MHITHSDSSVCERETEKSFFWHLKINQIKDFLLIKHFTTSRCLHSPNVPRLSSHGAEMRLRRVTSVHQGCFYPRDLGSKWLLNENVRGLELENTFTHTDKHIRGHQDPCEAAACEKWPCGSDLLWRIQSAHAHFVPTSPPPLPSSGPLGLKGDEDVEKHHSCQFISGGTTCTDE